MSAFLNESQVRARIEALVEVWLSRSGDIAVLPEHIADALEGSGWDLVQWGHNQEVTAGRVVLRPSASSIIIQFQVPDQESQRD
jgi:hypothetical protein